MEILGWLKIFFNYDEKMRPIINERQLKNNSQKKVSVLDVIQ